MHNLLNEIHKTVYSEMSQEKPFKISIYYMAESASELDEANPGNPVARTGKMSPFCALWISRVGPASKSFLFGHIINPLLTKLVGSRWLNIALFFCVFIDLVDSVSVKNAKKNLTNIQQPS